MKNKVTILDVAKAVGVTPSTVSHAISGKRPISAEVKKLIFQKIKELDYRPNLFASSMRNRETRRIGLVVEEWDNPKTADFCKLLSENFAKEGYEVFFSCAGVDLERGRNSLYAFSTGLVDGVINLLPQIDHGEAELLCGKVPVYTFQRDDFAPLILDYIEGARKALDILLENGHRSIGYLYSTTRHFGGEDPTVEFFKSYMKERGIAVQSGQIVQGLDTADGGEVAMEKLYSKVPVTAVFTGNDLMALGAYRWAEKRGISIPDELSVVGSDNIPLTEFVSPPLTTLYYSLEEAANYTVQVMKAKISGAATPFAPCRIIPEIITRSSVGKYPQKNKENSK